MPRKAKELGALEVSRLKETGSYAVGGVPGLYLRVEGASRAWVYRYVVKDSQKRRRMGLGPYPTITLARARELAREAFEQLQQGIDPLAHKESSLREAQKQRAKHMLFKEAARQCILSKEAEWKNAKHAQQWTNTLQTYAFPIMGNLSVVEIDTEEVLQVLSPIWETKTETANRVRNRIETVLNWATVQGKRDSTIPNPARWKGHLEFLLANPEKIKKVQHFKAIPYKIIPEEFKRILEAKGLGAQALFLQAMTVTRSNVVRHAVWEEFNLDEGYWFIPKEKMKVAKDQKIPLSTQTKEFLKNLPRTHSLVFPSKGKPLSDMTISAVLKRLNIDAVPHGFRSSFRDWAAETTSFEPFVVEMCLAHTISSKVEAAYRRGDLYEKRKIVMQAWADYCFS